MDSPIGHGAMNKPTVFINRHDMSAEQKRFYVRIEAARSEYRGLCYRGPLPSATRAKRSRRPELAIAASVVALLALWLFNPLETQIPSEVAVFGNERPKSLSLARSIIPKMNKAPSSLFADKPRLSARHRLSFRAPTRPVKASPGYVNDANHANDG